MADKMRVHILAKELSVSSKTIIEKCRAEGIDSVKNHMSTLSAGLHATIREWFSEGAHETTVETTARVDLKKARLRTRRKKTIPTATSGDEAVAVAEAPAVDEGVAEKESPAPPQGPHRTEEAASVKMPSPPSQPETPTPEVAPSPDATSLEQVPVQPQAAAPTDSEGETPTNESATATEPAQEPDDTEPNEKPVPPDPVTPAGPQNVPKPAKLRGPRVVRYEAPEKDTLPPRVGREAPRSPKPDSGRVTPGLPSSERFGGRTSRRKGHGVGRRAAGRAPEPGERTAEWRDRDLAERRERLAGATGRRIHHRKAQQTATGRQPVATGPKTHATVNEPVRMKDFCAATGLNFMQCFKVLKSEFDTLANVNMTLPTDVAQLLALNFGIELEVIPAKTKLDELIEESEKRERKNLYPRPPVVAMLGHVDHGKTSLLDAIRKTRVVAGEDGGITQHIGSYHLETTRGPVSFLDTPGHEAFTAMRARGAQLTDVVVLVVAADDGVMPQTVEAINHAKAAGVPIVVALNKIDLGRDNKVQIFGQLAEHGLLPTEWGGDVDVIETSATTGEGVKGLVEHLADLASILELKADPALPACGAVIEAETKPGVGAVVRVLLREGTLRVGDFVVCGNASGKVRAILNDCGERIEKVSPCVPAEIWGLDDVPLSGDKLYQVETTQRANEIAQETKKRRIEEGRVQSSKVKTLEEMFTQREAGEIPELNLILKADVDGSVAALKQSLDKIPSSEVRLALRHAGVGPVNDSDVLLATTCAGIVVAFRVDVPAGVRRLADQHGVDVRSYRIIYDVCDDIKKALEGLLKPEERIESRASVEVRQVFNFRRVGTVAGCFVTSGTVDRNHFAKVIRDGVVVREGARIASLKRFKDDVREVRAGMECGVRLEDYNDLHPGDQIETYEIVKVARTL